MQQLACAWPPSSLQRCCPACSGCCRACSTTCLAHALARERFVFWGVFFVAVDRVLPAQWGLIDWVARWAEQPGCLQHWGACSWPVFSSAKNTCQLALGATRHLALPACCPGAPSSQSRPVPMTASHAMGKKAAVQEVELPDDCVNKTVEKSLEFVHFHKKSKGAGN